MCWERVGSLGEGTAGIRRQQGGEASFVAADMTKSADVQAYAKAALDTCGRIDCFFNDASVEGQLADTADHDADSGVRVNAVCPGPIDTGMIQSLAQIRSPNDPAAFAAG